MNLRSRSKPINKMLRTLDDSLGRYESFMEKERRYGT